MAEAGVQLQRESFSCSVCLELLKEPVTLPCGHSYCRRCISSYWDGEEQKEKKVFSCPQCRQTFTPRPVLMKNTMLAELVEKLKESRLQEDPRVQSYAGAEDVACDSCTGRKRKAFKSCLNCVASYCETHLQPHHQSAAFMRHKLVDPSKELQENLCSRHEEVMKMFCRTDQLFICIYCSVEEHKGHHVVSAAAERSERERKLQESRADLHKNIQDREKEVQLLEEQLKSLQLSADHTVEHNQQVFTELIHLLQRRSSELEKEVRSKQEVKVRAVRSLQEKLEEEIGELKERDAELEKLFLKEDPVQFVHSFSSLSVLSVSTHSPSLLTDPVSSFQEVTAAVSQLRDHLHNVLKEDWTNVCGTVDKLELLQLPEPTSRAGFLKYSQKITLDPNTVYRQLRLSKGNRKVTRMNKDQHHPPHPDRFTGWSQVLSRESLTGRSYWEVEVEVKDAGYVGLGYVCLGSVRVGVSYKSISRAGYDCRFGCNDKSWMLQYYLNKYTFHHNNINTELSGPPSSRVGVYVDQLAGSLSFYSVSDTMTLLHRGHASFTEPLHMGVRINYGGSVEIYKL